MLGRVRALSDHLEREHLGCNCVGDQVHLATRALADHLDRLEFVRPDETHEVAREAGRALPHQRCCAKRHAARVWRTADDVYSPAVRVWICVYVLSQSRQELAVARDLGGLNRPVRAVGHRGGPRGRACQLQV